MRDGGPLARSLGLDALAPVVACGDPDRLRALMDADDVEALGYEDGMRDHLEPSCLSPSRTNAMPWVGFYPVRCAAGLMVEAEERTGGLLRSRAGLQAV